MIQPSGRASTTRDRIAESSAGPVRHWALISRAAPSPAGWWPSLGAGAGTTRGSWRVRDSRSSASTSRPGPFARRARSRSGSRWTSPSRSVTCSGWRRPIPASSMAFGSTRASVPSTPSDGRNTSRCSPASSNWRDGSSPASFRWGPREGHRVDRHSPSTRSRSGGFSPRASSWSRTTCRSGHPRAVRVANGRYWPDAGSHLPRLHVVDGRHRAPRPYALLVPLVGGLFALVWLGESVGVASAAGAVLTLLGLPQSRGWLPERRHRAMRAA
jgi:hypothetical protein